MDADKGFYKIYNRKLNFQSFSILAAAVDKSLTHEIRSEAAFDLAISVNLSTRRACQGLPSDVSFSSFRIRMFGEWTFAVHRCTAASNGKKIM